MKSTANIYDLYIPDQSQPEIAFPRTTHLGIGAHQDDLEFMALHGILACYQKSDLWFGGVTCTDGAGSSRIGPYADCSDEEMKKIRHVEQRKAAMVGDYAFMAQLGHPSSTVKKPDERVVLEKQLSTLIAECRPQVVYTHNPFDKHPTHVGVFQATVAAILSLPPGIRPTQLLGCEVWRGLDWMPDTRKMVLDVSDRGHLSSALNGIFDSQIAGGKRYDLAVEGRRRANSTFLDAHETDTSTASIFAVDCTHCLCMEKEFFLKGDWLQEELRAFEEEVNCTWQSTLR